MWREKRIVTYFFKFNILGICVSELKIQNYHKSVVLHYFLIIFFFLPRELITKYINNKFLDFFFFLFQSVKFIYFILRIGCELCDFLYNFSFFFINRRLDIVCVCLSIIFNNIIIEYICSCVSVLFCVFV